MYFTCPGAARAPHWSLTDVLTPRGLPRINGARRSYVRLRGRERAGPAFRPCPGSAAIPSHVDDTGPFPRLGPAAVRWDRPRRAGRPALRGALAALCEERERLRTG